VSELLPCPFCSGTDIRIDRHPGAGRGVHRDGEDAYSMCCYRCGATFPNRYRRELLVNAWNTRAQPVIDPASEPVAEVDGHGVNWLAAAKDRRIPDGAKLYLSPPVKESPEHALSLKRMKLAYEVVMHDSDKSVTMTRLGDLLGNETGSENWPLESFLCEGKSPEGV
jgi:Lar family restriction alleviation protein